METRVILLSGTAVLFGLALLYSIYSLVRTMRNSLEASVPLSASMQFSLPAAGKKTLYIQGPRGANLSRLKFSMKTSSGIQVELKKILVPVKVSGLSTVKLSFADFESPDRGDYLLDASGIPETKKDLKVLIYQKNTFTMIGLIMAIVFSSLITIGSVVMTLIALKHR